MEFVTTTANGRLVFYEPESSHTATHLKDTPQLLGIIASCLSKNTFEEERVFTEYDTGITVGNSDLVETDESDTIIYAKRLNRDTYTRFTKSRNPVATSYISAVLYQDDQGNYELASAWVGRQCPPFPDDPRADKESLLFWSNHALAWGTQEVQPGSETTLSPW